MAFDYWVHTNNDDAWNEFIIAKEELNSYFKEASLMQLNCK